MDPQNVDQRQEEERTCYFYEDDLEKFMRRGDPHMRRMNHFVPKDKKGNAMAVPGSPSLKKFMRVYSAEKVMVIFWDSKGVILRKVCILSRRTMSAASGDSEETKRLEVFCSGKITSPHL